jgi:hypothetical protein
MPYRVVFSLFILLAIVACTSVNYKPTAYAYQIDQEKIKQSAIKSVLIADINYGTPSRHYLTRHEKSVDNHVADFLEAQDLRLRSSRLFDQLWQRQLTSVGDVYNPSTGKVTSAYSQALAQTLAQLFEQQPSLDAVIFTNLVEIPVRYGNASNRSAQWHGVMRKVKMQGVGDDFSTDFDWFEAVNGISLEVTIVNREQDIIFHSFGGIQVAQAIEIQNRKGKFVRRHDLLRDEDDIEEGINLAFHPFIYWDDHPGFE